MVFPLTRQYLTTGHAFNWNRATAVGQGTAKPKREVDEARNTTSTYVNQSINRDPYYKALREY